MKTLSSVLIFFAVIAVIAYAVTFTGCSNSVTSTVTGTGTQTYPALTERDFIDTNFYAVPGSVVMLYLEDLHSPVDTTHPDTDSIGTDVVRIRLSRTVVHTVKLSDSCRFTVTIKDKMTGAIVNELDPVNNFKTITMPAGDYLIKIRSLVEYTGDSNKHQNIFFQPDRNASFSRGGSSQQVYVDSNSVNTLFTTNSCVSCNLSYAYFFYADFQYANLSHANLSHANLSYTTLDAANLSYANLSYANLSYEHSGGVNLSYANLSYANLYNAGLVFANLSYANFSYANLIYTSFCEANKTGIITTGAIVNRFTQCWP
jgi:hypothetical protein